MKKAMVGIAILMKEKDGELREKLKEIAINNLTRTELKDTFTFLAQMCVFMVIPNKSGLTVTANDCNSSVFYEELF